MLFLPRWTGSRQYRTRLTKAELELTEIRADPRGAFGRIEPGEARTIDVANAHPGSHTM